MERGSNAPTKVPVRENGKNPFGNPKKTMSLDGNYPGAGTLKCGPGTKPQDSNFSVFPRQ